MDAVPQLFVDGPLIFSSLGSQEDLTRPARRPAPYSAKSSQVVGLRDRMAIIRTQIFSSAQPYAGSGELIGVGRWEEPQRGGLLP